MDSQKYITEIPVWLLWESLWPTDGLLWECLWRIMFGLRSEIFESQMNFCGKECRPTYGVCLNPTGWSTTFPKAFQQRGYYGKACGLQLIHLWNQLASLWATNFFFIFSLWMYWKFLFQQTRRQIESLFRKKKGPHSFWSLCAIFKKARPLRWSIILLLFVHSSFAQFWIFFT